MARMILVPENWAARIPGHSGGSVYMNFPEANSHYEASKALFESGIISGIPAAAIRGFSGSGGTHPSGVQPEQMKLALSPEQLDQTRNIPLPTVGAGDDSDRTNDENKSVPVLEDPYSFLPGDLNPHVTEGGEGEGASLPPMFRPETVNPDAPASQGGTDESQPTIKSAAELALLYPDVQMTPKQQGFIDGILNGQYTPEELSAVLNDPEFQAIFNHPEFGPLLNPALQLAVTNATEQLKVAGGVTQAELAAGATTAAGDAGASNAGALLRSGASIDQIMESIQLGATGLSGDADVLDSQRIAASGGFDNVEDMLEQQRIAASGGLDNNSDILAVMQARAANNAFGSLQLGDGEGAEGSRLADILSIIEAEQSGANGANQVAREGNYLNFIGNPAAVGAARAMGKEIPDPMQEMRAALDAESATGVGQVTAASAMRALETQDPNSGFNNVGLDKTDGIGALNGLTRNFTEGDFNSRSNAEKSSITGQLAYKQGIGSDEIGERARSFTPGDTSVKRQLV